MSLDIKKLVLATHNDGKVKEIQNLLAPYKIEVLSAKDFDLAEPEETEDTFIGNATIKARYVQTACRLPALADDSGLCVDALNGAPGVYSADWAGEPRDFQKAMSRVQDELGNNDNRKASFTSVLVLATKDGKLLTAEGHVDGTLVWPPRGSNGFGYDAMFVPEGESRTFGEMTLDEKKKFSHRARAFASLIAKYF